MPSLGKSVRRLLTASNDGAGRTKIADLTDVSKVGEHNDYLNGMMAPGGRANSNFLDKSPAEAMRAQVKMNDSLPWRAEILPSNKKLASEALEAAVEQYEAGMIGVHGMDRIAQKFFGRPWLEVERQVLDWYQSGF